MYLCKPNGIPICQLNGIDIEDASINIRLNNQYELSFKYFKYIDTYDGKIISNGYNSFDVGMEILVENIGYFKLEYPKTYLTEDNEYKIISATSIDCELENKDLINFKINLGTKQSLEYLVEYDENETEELINEYNGLPYDYIMFYNTLDIQLENILNKYTDGVITDKETIDKIVDICKIIPRLKNKIVKNKDNTNVDIINYVEYIYDSQKNISSIILTDFNTRISELIEFYGKYKKQLSLLDLALEKCNCNWKIGYVDEELCNKRFQFDVSGQNIYSFLTQELASTVVCLCMFDITTRTINIVKPDRLGKDTGILLSRRNVLNTLDITLNENNLCTRYNVSGGNNLNLNYVNFGTSRIDDISYYLYARDNEYNTRKYMSDELANKYIEYSKDRELVRDVFIDLSKQYNQNIANIYDLNYRVPNDYLSNNWGSYNTKDLENLLKSFKSLLCTLITMYKEEYSDLGCNDDGSVNEDYIKTTVYWQDYFSYNNIISQITYAIDSYSNNSNYEDIQDEVTLKEINAFKTEWSLYGIVELQNKLETYKNTMKVMRDSKIIYLKEDSDEPKTWSELNVGEKADFNNTEFNYKYKEYYDNYSAYVSCKTYLDELLVQLDNLNTQQDELQSKRKLISSYMDLNNYNKIELYNILYEYGKVTDYEINNIVENITFTYEDIKTITMLYIDRNYSNENILTTLLDDSVTEIDKQKELLLDAKEKLSIDCQPQIDINGTFDNFLLLDDFSKDSEQFEIGNYITIEYFDNYYIKLRLVGFSFNPCIPQNELSLEFSNYIMSKSKRSDLTYLLNNASGGNRNSSSSNNSNNSNSFGVGDDIDVTISNTMLSKLLNTEMFSSRVTNVILDTLDVNMLTAKSATFSDLYNGTTNIDGRCITTGYIVDKSYNGHDGSINNTTGTIINLENGKFNFGGGSLKFNGTSLDLTGTIYATSGRIGTVSNGLYFNISENGELYTGSKSSLYSNVNGVYVGHNGICCGGGGYNSTNYQFRVDNYGQMSCSYASISYGSISYANISYGKIGSFSLNLTSLYSGNRTSLSSSNSGCYIGVDGISYKGDTYTFSIDSSGDCWCDRIMSNEGIQIIAHNTSSGVNNNGNVVVGYGNTNNCNIYFGDYIRFISSSTGQDFDNGVRIEFGTDGTTYHLRPCGNSNSLGSIYLGTKNRRWAGIYADNIYIGSNGTSISDIISSTVSSSVSSSINSAVSNATSNCVKTNTGTTITSAQINMGYDKAADGNRYYFNDNATGRFNALRYSSLEQISSVRYKENIEYKSNDYWHDALMQVKCCTYNYINGNDKSTKIGVIAEDLDNCMPELVVKNEYGECEAVTYIDFIVPLVSEVQRLNKEIDEYKKIIQNYSETVLELQDSVNKLINKD